MFNTNVHVLFFIIISAICFVVKSDTQVTDFKYWHCNSKSLAYSIYIKNVHLQKGENNILDVSGTLSTTKYLTSPLTAKVSLEKKMMLAWITVPCINDMGSCHYADLCSYGYPETEQCPSEFVDNNIPCRCPFPIGNYTMSSQFQLIESNRPLITNGQYRAKVVISDPSNDELGCFRFSFALTS